MDDQANYTSSGKHGHEKTWPSSHQEKHPVMEMEGRALSRPDELCSSRDLISYTVRGTGKPLLLIHGWAMHAGVWAEAASEFSSQYQAITVDLRGHGASASMPGPYTFATFADDIRRLTEHLKLKNITAVGWSMGVSVLLKMLEAEASHIDSLVFISGTPSFISREGYMHGVPPIIVQRLLRQIDRNYPSGLKNFHNILFTPEEQSSLQGSALYAELTDLHAAPAKAAALESLQCLQDERGKSTYAWLYF
ncbi:MAG: alpha/beta fold hydrolase, partial [Pseudomonadota bacterium]